MAQLRRNYEQFQQAGVEILVVGPEGKNAFQKYWQKNQLPFRGLPDPDHSVLKLYGQEIKLFKMGRMPAMVIIDREGTARFVHYGHSMEDIPENDQVLSIVRELS